MIDDDYDENEKGSLKGSSQSNLKYLDDSGVCVCVCVKRLEAINIQ